MTDLAPWLIGLPLAAAVVSFLLGPRPAAALAAPALAGLAALAAAVALHIYKDGPVRHAVGGWGAPLGIELYADGLAALMLLMTAAIAGLVGLYARAYFTRAAGGEYFWPLAWFLIAAMDAVYLSADIFNLYVALELLGLSAVGLVVLAGGAAALAAGMRYLLAALVGSLFYLLGVALLYGAHGTVSLAHLALLVEPAPGDWLAAALMTLGLALKTAVFPLHYWLPPAHGGAVAPVSALLSALVVKTSFYLLLRLWFDLFTPLVTSLAAQLLGVLGAGAIVWGSVLALRARRLKMLVAYSTAAQIGYLFLLFPLAVGPEAASAWQGGVYQALSHAFAKSAMFLAAGTMVLTAGRDELTALDGISARLPVSLFAFALAGVSLMGLPPSGGFVAKWLLLKGAVASGQWWWIAVIILGGLLAAAYVFRVLRHAFLPAADGPATRPPLPRVMELSAFVLAAASLLLGLYATQPLALIEVGAPFPGAAP